MGQKIVLTDAFTDLTLPKIYPDPGISAGTLFLFDGAHSQGAFSSLANAGVVPNVARDVAAGILGVAASACDGDILFSQENVNTIKVERTPKLGVHVISSQTAQTASTNRWGVTMPLALRQWMYDHSEDHGFYASIIKRPTRAEGAVTTTVDSSPASFTGSPPSSNYAYHMQNASPKPDTGAKFIGRYFTPSPLTVGQNSLLAIGVIGFTGTRPGSVPAASTAIIIGSGSIGGFGAINANPSDVLYRAKIEDLTLTKRANGGLGGTLAEEYAAAVAQDQADFAAMFGVGGKFYGDTLPTNPASFP